MSKLSPIIELMILICLIGNTNGIRCYNCLADCSDPFNKTNSNANPLVSPSGWCMKLKTSTNHDSLLIRSSAPLGLCTKNKCKSTHHDSFKGTGCCCNTELCNHSNTTAKSLSSFIVLALIIGMSAIVNY